MKHLENLAKLELSASDLFSLLAAQLELRQLIPAVLELVLRLTGAQRAFLVLSDEKGQTTLSAGRSSEGTDLADDHFRGSTTILKSVFTERAPLFISSIPEHGDFADLPSVTAGDLQSVICLPLLKSENDILGVLYLDSSSPVYPLQQQHMRLMQVLANHVAISLQNASLYEQLRAKTEELEMKNEKIAWLNQQLEQRIDQQSGRISGMQHLLEESQRQLSKRYGLGNIIGHAPAMQRAFTILQRVATTHATVLIHGESGTGKELVARYIHYSGQRASKPMVSINCGAFNDTLLESELFGHVKGAFTGADQAKVGLFELAHEGTIFLDEVGDMSMEMQKKLLRVLQNGEVRPIGSKTINHVNVRVISASNRDLKDLAKSGEFREDLLFRLNVIQVEMPPLRERREDIPLLIDHLTHVIESELNRTLETLPALMVKKFVEYRWPGNVRELENELRRYFILGPEYRFDPGTDETASNQSELASTIDAAEKLKILKALESTRGNRTRAAKALGIPLRTLYAKLKKHNIKPKD